MNDLRLVDIHAKTFVVRVEFNGSQQDYPVEAFEVREHGLVPIVSGQPAPGLAFANWRLIPLAERLHERGVEACRRLLEESIEPEERAQAIYSLPGREAPEEGAA